MEESRKKNLLDAGVDVDSALDRFLGNEELLMRFLRKFPNDPNYELFREAMKEQRYEDAFKAAHTFKGVCGNLSISRLFEIISREVEFLRRKGYSEAEGLVPEVEQEYEKVIEILKAI